MLNPERKRLELLLARVPADDLYLQAVGDRARRVLREIRRDERNRELKAVPSIQGTAEINRVYFALLKELRPATVAASVPAPPGVDA